MANPVINRSNFTVKVNKNGSMLQSTRPITAKNQIEEIRSLDDIPGVNNALKEDGATIVWNASTGQYEIKLYNYDDYLSIGDLYIQHLHANNSLGVNGQVLHTNGNTIYWANGVTSVTTSAGINNSGTSSDQVLSVNTAYIATLTSNNATFAYGKRESDLIVNFALFAGDANFAYVSNSALFANNTTYAYGKRESDLIVNFALYAGDANFAYVSNTATNSQQLDGHSSSYYTNASNMTTGTVPSDILPIIDCGTY